MNAIPAEKNRGFTLIELLVVIAIISLLSSILMPVFSRARESARKIVCSSRLYQLGMAVNMYMQDNDGYYPVAWAFWGPVNTPPLPLEPNLKTCLQSYVLDDRIWWCPSWAGCYGINAWGNPDGGSYDFIVPTPVTEEVIGEPPSAGRFGSNWSDAEVERTTSYPLLFCGSHWTRALGAHMGANDDAFFKGKEMGGTNILYADGHVKWEPFDLNKWDRIYRSPR